MPPMEPTITYTAADGEVWEAPASYVDSTIAAYSTSIFEKQLSLRDIVVDRLDGAQDLRGVSLAGLLVILATLNHERDLAEVTSDVGAPK